jgi:hypothetical protein
VSVTELIRKGGLVEAMARGLAARVLGVMAAFVVVAVPVSLVVAPSALAATTGQIAGTVTRAAGGAPIEGIKVCASSTSAEEFSNENFACSTTGSRGEYTIAGLASGNYDVEFSSLSESEPGYVTQYYQDTTSYEHVKAVPVAAPGTTSGIDAALEEGGRITGEVTDASGGAPIGGIEVCASAVHAEGFGCAKTKSNGVYTITGLASGEYEIEFSSPFGGGLDFVSQYWEYKSSGSEATPISLIAPETRSNIDAKLQEGGRIEGRVTDASTGSVLTGALVCASTGNGEGSLGECAITNSSGEYTISALASGYYKIKFDAGKSYTDQYYNNKSYAAEAELVQVTAPSISSGIDAAMQLKSTPPANTTPPVVSGTPAVGSNLLCAPGLWTGSPPLAFTYQWLRNDAPIGGANTTGYTVQSADAGNSISCQVTAKNGRGEKSATSAAVAIPANVVVSPPPPAPTPKVTIAGSKIVVSGKSVTVRIACGDATCTGSAELTVQTTTKRRKGKRMVSRKEKIVLAKGAYSLTAGKGGALVLRLTAAGRQRLAHVKRHPLAVQLTVSVAHGQTVVKSVRIS